MASDTVVDQPTEEETIDTSDSEGDDLLSDTIIVSTFDHDYASTLKPISNHYPKLGKLLQLSEAKVEELTMIFANNPYYGLDHVLEEWTRWSCDRTRFGNPNCRWLVNAVNEIDKEMAEVLEKKMYQKIEKEKARRRDTVPAGVITGGIQHKMYQKAIQEQQLREKEERERRRKERKIERRRRRKEQEEKLKSGKK